LRWRIKVEDIENGHVIDDECDVLLSCTGILNKWKWPEIEGLDQFTGPVLHSARWDTTFDFGGKTVAVIGAGSSAIQIVPSLQPSRPLCLTPTSSTC
jgi:cation diffusion facilitator CzcD-associated flavoprotein CzcO